MLITVKMPKVAKCSVTTCAYNSEDMCHARAITVGDHTRPACDTFFTSSQHIRKEKRVAGVGACKVSICKFNKDFECHASEIKIAYSETQQDGFCLTFQQ